MTTDNELHKKLIDAANLIGEYTSENLPEGWMLTLECVPGESSLDLVDPEGNIIQETFGEQGYSAVVSACDYAKEHDSEFDELRG